MRQLFSLRLSGKIFLAMVFAVLVPLVILAVSSFLSVRQVSLENLESFLEESGEGRYERIGNDFANSFILLQDFVDENQRDLLAIFANRSSAQITDDPAIEQTEDEIRNQMRTELISSEYFNSVSLLVYLPFASEARQSERVPAFSDKPEDPDNIALNAVIDELSTIEDIGNFDERSSNQSQDFLIVQLDNVWHIMILTAVYDRDVDTDRPFVAGFILADLNLDRLILANLEGETSAYNTYAYMILPQTDNQFIATNPSLVDLNSAGAARAIGAEFGTASYPVGEEGFQREVIGYTARLNIRGQSFSLVVEANQAEIGNQIFDQGANRIFPITLGGLFISILLYIYLRSNIVNPTGRLREAIVAMIGGDFEHPVKDTGRGDEIGMLATSFVDLRDNIRDLTEDMNRRLRERTRDVQVTQDIGRAVTAERDLERLMNRVVNLIVQNFPSIYHAQIFLLDEDKQYAVLRSSTGQAGRELLSRGHKLGVGSVSVIGQVSEQGQVIIARDTAESSVHRQNEFLGETRAELAIPLRLGNDIIGALDVQSKLRDSFDEDQVAALQTLADQITIAIENARLYAESARLLASIEQERGASTRNAWKQYMYQERKDSLVIHSGVKTDYEFDKLSQAVLRNGKALVGDATSRNTIPFAVPIMLRGQTLGVVEYEVPQAEFNYDKVLLAEELVARLAISLENARLFQSSQQSAERERIVNTISTKLTGQTDIEDILQTAIREVGQALRTPQVAIRLTAGDNGNGSHEEETNS
jgi:GAF domain-containing protein/HAMP domain-containing protein